MDQLEKLDMMDLQVTLGQREILEGLGLKDFLDLLEIKV